MRSTRRTRWGYREKGRFLVPLALLAVVAALGAVPDAAAAAKRKSPKQSRSAEQDVLRYLPDGCQVLGWVNVDSLRQSELGRKVSAAGCDLLKKCCEELASFGLATEQVDRIVFGGGHVVGGKVSQYATVVLRCKQHVDIPDENAAADGPEVGKVIRSVKLDRKGNTFTVSVSVQGALAAAVAEGSDAPGAVATFTPGRFTA